MKHFRLLPVLAAAALVSAALAGEETIPLQPGLEIYDATGPFDPFAGTNAAAPAAPLLLNPAPPAPASQPPYRAPEIGRPAYGAADAPFGAPPSPAPAAPRAADDVMDPYADPFADLEAPAPGFEPEPDPQFTPQFTPRYAPPSAPQYAEQPGYLDEPDFAPPEAPAFAPEQPALIPVADKLNRANRNFPGLADAAASGNLEMAGGIVWDTLRQRRVVDATMARGVRGSLGAGDPYAIQTLRAAIAYLPDGYEDPLAPAQRINSILDAFQQPFLDDPAFTSFMPGILESLNRDIQAVAFSLFDTPDDAVFLELARTYIRAATTCDFFTFPRRELSNDVKMIVDRAGGMFRADGSSLGGDTGGITGNLFRMMLMIEHYTRDDSWFRRGISGLWKRLERPARHLLAVAGPDYSLPRFGARGSRELLPEEVRQIENTFPPEPPLISRIGLVQSVSHPRVSTERNEGGVYVMQDALRADGRYLAVRFGGASGLPGVPTHEDFGSMTLMTRGGTYLVDAGGFGGQAAGAAAHGGLSLDGQHVSVAGGAPGEASDAVWRTNASLDYVTDMAGFADGKTWQRSVVYVKNLPGETLTDYWMVLDSVDMKGDPTPRTADVRFQLAPGVTAYQDGPGIVATAGMAGSGLRIFAVDAGATMRTADYGAWAGSAPGQVFDAAGAGTPAPSVTVTRQITGDSTTATLLYPMDTFQHRPLRIARDSDIIRGRTGAVVIDHGLERVDVVAWAPPGTELVTPTLNLQLSADLAVFRVRRGRIARIDVVNMERFQAMEPDGGQWSMRVNGPAQTLTIEPERGGGWQVLSDPANRGAASFFDVNFGPAVQRDRFDIRPGEMRVLPR